MIQNNVIIKDISTSIRLIDDECNIYAIVTPKTIKRTNVMLIDIIRWRIKVDCSKDKALLCCITKKSPYTIPINNPRVIEIIYMIN